MSDFTANLQLPYLMPAQAQKHVTVNEALRRLDSLCQANAVSMSVTAQPASPADGDLYIVPAGKTGADWGGAFDWSLGLYADGTWDFVTPREGWLVWVKDAHELFAWNGSAWTPAVTTETLRAAGALMDDELANLAAVKTIDQGLTTTSSVTYARLTLTGNSSTFLFEANQNNASFASYVSAIRCARTASNSYNFLGTISDIAGTPDIEHRLAGNGNAFADGSWTGGGADYAEYFEWEDGNPDNEDRRGFPVVIVPGSGKIGIASSDDDPADIIGVVSSAPVVVGDAAWNHWARKYLRDDFGAPLLEPYSVIEWTETPETGKPILRSYASDQMPEGVAPPPDAVTRTTDDADMPLMRRVLNPAFDPDAPYTPRSERPEWDAVGLMGKLRVRAGAPVGSRWIKLRDITADVQEWLVR